MFPFRGSVDPEGDCLNVLIADLRVAPDALVDVRVEGVAADGHDVQVVAVLAHPILRHFASVRDDRDASHVLKNCREFLELNFSLFIGKESC